MCDSSFNQSAFVALVFVTGTCNLYIRPTFIFCIPVRGTLLLLHFFGEVRFIFPEKSDTQIGRAFSQNLLHNYSVKISGPKINLGEVFPVSIFIYFTS